MKEYAKNIMRGATLAAAGIAIILTAQTCIKPRKVYTLNEAVKTFAQKLPEHRSKDLYSIPIKEDDSIKTSWIYNGDKFNEKTCECGPNIQIGLYKPNPQSLAHEYAHKVFDCDTPKEIRNKFTRLTHEYSVYEGKWPENKKPLSYYSEYFASL